MYVLYVKLGSYMCRMQSRYVKKVMITSFRDSKKNNQMESECLTLKTKAIGVKWGHLLLLEGLLITCYSSIYIYEKLIVVFLPE